MELEWRQTWADLGGSVVFTVRGHKKKNPHKIYICTCINCQKHLLPDMFCHKLSDSHGPSWTGDTGPGVLGTQSMGGYVELPSSTAPAACQELRFGSLAAGGRAGSGGVEGQLCHMGPGHSHLCLAGLCCPCASPLHAFIRQPSPW